MTQELSQLTQRLETLERQNRRFKLAGLGLAGMLAVVGTVSFRAPTTMVCDTVSAERFVLHDGRGNKRMVIDAYNTEPHMQFRNRAGKTVASFGVDDKKGEPYLTFFDANGKAKGTKAKSESCTPSDCSSKKDDGSIAMR